MLFRSIENAVASQATIIDGANFVGLNKYATYVDAGGGAILNSGSSAELGNINANFIGNYVSTNESFTNAFGGAIYNDSGTLGNITGNFIGNYAAVILDEFSDYTEVYGGAIYNYSGTIDNISGDFIGNYVFSPTAASGGAISNGYGLMKLGHNF